MIEWDWNNRTDRASLRRLVSFWEPDRIGFAFNDPPKFSQDEVNPEIFPKLLDHLTDPESPLGETAMIRLIESFSSSCTKTEWKLYYQPILKRSLDAPSLTEFNSKVSEDERIVMVPVQPVVTRQTPTEDGFFYPITSPQLVDRIHIIIFSDHVEMFLAKNYQPWANDKFNRMVDSLSGFDGVEYPLVLEAIFDSKEPQALHLIDFFQFNQIDNWPGSMRREILEAFYTEFCSDDFIDVYLGEGLPGNQSDIQRVMAEFSSMGHDTGTLFKPAKNAYSSKAYFISGG